MMRTTLDLDETVLAAARAIAHAEGVSLGAAVSRLARRGLEPTRSRPSSGFPVFDADPEAPLISLELVDAYRDDD